jgi:hypothetical protein
VADVNTRWRGSGAAGIEEELPMGVLTGCEPRPEVLKGDLEDAIFAAHFGDLIANVAPPVYGDARTFFQNTHPAKLLATVVTTISRRLANPAEGGATLRLSTGFGGGKTHTPVPRDLATR